MRTPRLAVAAAALTILLAACGGGQHAEQQRVLTKATRALEACAVGVETADTPQALADELDRFASQMEPLLPAMQAMMRENPEWQDTPPPALAETFAAFQAASLEFQAAMPALMRMAGEHGDHAQLQTALQRFHALVAQL